MFNLLRPIAAASCCLLAGGCLLAAGQAAWAAAPAAAGSASSADQSPRVEETQPSIYYLPDKQGNLQPVLDFKYQDFVDLYKLRHQLPQRDLPPRYSLERIAAAGTADKTHAELTVHIEAVVQDDDWVRIPLRLDGALLRGGVQYKGSGRQFVQYEGPRAGYACWIRGQPDSRHKLTLTLLVPLETVGEATRLRLYIPRAAASELKLSVPVPGAIGTASEGATLASSAADGGKATEFSVVGAAGDFQLSWHKPHGAAAETPVVLEAVGTVLARLDGRWITTEATLSVRSRGAAFDRLSVRLPPDAELLAAEKPGAYTLVPLDAPAGAGKALGQRSVEVRLARKTAGPVEIRLGCRRAYDPIKGQTWCDLAGFEVVGAARQWGAIAVAVGGDWQTFWGPSRETRQIDRLPDAFRKEEDIVAVFEYSAEPYVLPVRLASRKTRVSVEPEYVLLVDANQVSLEGALAYTIRGAKVSTLEIAAAGWELDQLGPESLVAADTVMADADTAWVPLLRPSSGAIEVHFRAHRAIPDGAASLTIPLPQPRGVSVGPASLAVAAADNVELAPRRQDIKGLVHQRTALPVKLPARQQPPLYYRGVGGEAVFAADFRIRSQQISVAAASLVSIAHRSAAVEQKFSYSVAYEPIDQLTLSIPRALAAGRILARISNEAPAPLVVAAGDPAGDSPTVLARLALPEPRIGSCEVALGYSVPLPEPPSDRPAAVAVPLAMPADGELASNRLAVKADAGVRASLPKEKQNPKSPWLPADRDADFDPQADLSLASALRTSSVVLNLQRETDAAAGEIVVDRAWVQSRLTSAAREDRAVLQLATDRNELQCVLPADAAVAHAVVLVDGRAVEPRVLDGNRLLIPLGQRRACRGVSIELRYHFAGPRPPRGAMAFEFPRLLPGAWMRRMYWQLVLPANEHLLSGPDGFTGEFVWRWSGAGLGRTPVLDQSQLELWSGAEARDAVPDRSNVYLFSSLGRVRQADVWTASRTWIVLWASGAALAVGLLLIYVPAGRHPTVLLVGGAALLAVGLIAPEPTLLLAEAASLGMILTLVAWFLRRRLARRQYVVARGEPSAARIEMGSTHTIFRPAAAAGSRSTAPAPPPAGESPP
jgi:hypothetical protein